MPTKSRLKETVRGLNGSYILILSFNGVRPGIYTTDFNPRQHPNEPPIVPLRGAFDQITGMPLKDGMYTFSTGPEFRRRYPRVEGQIQTPTEQKKVVLRVEEPSMKSMV